jgi:hypothetical protein
MFCTAKDVPFNKRRMTMIQNSKGKGSKPSLLQAFVVVSMVVYVWAALILSAMGYVAVDINEIIFVFVPAAFSWAAKQ